MPFATFAPTPTLISPPEGVPASPYITPAAVEADVVLIEAEIGPNGGVARSPGFSVVITFPPGAVSDPVLLVVRRLDRSLEVVPVPPVEFSAGDTLLDIEVTTRDGTSVATLLKEVEVCVRYGQGDLEASDGDPSLLALGRYDTEDALWEILHPTSGNDTSAICVGTQRLSLWMVFAIVPAAATMDGMSLLWVLAGSSMIFLTLVGLSFTPRGRQTYRAVLLKFRMVRRLPPRVSQPVQRADEPAQMDQTLDSAHRSRVRASLVQARQRAIQTLRHLESREIQDPRLPRDIAVALDGAIEDIKRCSEPTRGLLLALLDATASDVEAVLEQGLSQALHTAPVPVAVELLEAARACRVARFIARIAANRREFPKNIGPLGSFRDRIRVDVSFGGELGAVYPRHCVVAGVKVILPPGDTVSPHLSPGVRVSVEGVLGPKATVFARSCMSVRLTDGLPNE